MPTKPFHYEIIVDGALLPSLKSLWNDLCARSKTHYFTDSFDWCWSSWKVMAQGRRLHCLVLYKDGKAVLIMPFVVQRRLLWSFARPLGAETTEYSNILVEDGPDAERLATFAWQVLRKTCRCDVIRLPFVRQGSLLDRIASRERALSSEIKFPLSYLSWENYPTWESYYNSLNRRHNRDIIRRHKRLNEQGETTLESVTAPAERVAVIDWTLERKKEWVAFANKKNKWIATKQYRDILALVASEPASEDGASGHLSISVLKCDNQIIAVEIAREDNLRVEFFLSIYDTNYHNYSPSHILMEAQVKRAFDKGLVVDLRLGKEPYKDYWHPTPWSATSYEFNNSVWGAVFIMLRNGSRHVSKLIKKIH